MFFRNHNRGVLKWRIEERSQGSAASWIWTTIIAIIGAAACIAVLFDLAGTSVQNGFAAIAAGAFGSRRALLATLTLATPLVFTGLAVAVAFRAKLWNIGAEGQLFAGAMTAYGVTRVIHAPRPLLVPLLILSGFIGGGSYGALAGWLRSRFAVSEVISTVLLNYIVVLALSGLVLGGPWSDHGSFYPQTPVLAPEAWLPVLFQGSKLTIAFPLAIFAALVLYMFVFHTSRGYEIRAFGHSPRVISRKGPPGAAIVLAVMFFSGGLAGLAGVGEVFGVHHRLLEGISPGFGYTGVVVAIIARLNPLGIVPAAILFGALQNAAITLPIRAGVPSSFADLLQAVLLILYIAAAAVSRYRVLWNRHVG